LTMALTKRYDFVLLFDVQDGNPNGDPDAGNLPRIDAETGMGLVTDVCIKRKVRNFVQLTKAGQDGYDIYVKEKAVLGRAHVAAFEALNISLGEGKREAVPQDLRATLEEFALPEGLSVEEEEDQSFLLVAADADMKAVKKEISEAKPSPALRTFLNAALKGVKARRPSAVETGQGRDWMCEHYYDIRTFGAVMSLKSAPNCGQVRGPIQITFARSVEPVVALEHSITRMAVATEAEAEKQGGDNRTMGRKYTIPYGLYRAHGFVSAHLANQTGFSEDDLKLFWQALTNMFEHDRSAARGLMSTRGLYVFEHSDALGNAPAHQLFESVQVQRKEGSAGPARSFADYVVKVRDDVPEKVKVLALV
jgi:CRISPR-associated protein Csd2